MWHKNMFWRGGSLSATFLWQCTCLLGLYLFIGVSSSDSSDFERFPSAYSKWRELRHVSDLQAYPFVLKFPAFSDFAMKERVVYLPRETSLSAGGSRLIFPIGTVIEKHFYYAKPTEGCAGESASVNGLWRPSIDSLPIADQRCLIETRVLQLTSDGWQPFIYRWLPDQSDAQGLPQGVVTRVAFDKSEKSFTYKIPSLTDCYQCHQGAFEGKRELLPIGPTLVERIMPNEKGLAALLALKIQPVRSQTARDYLDINCAHCHNPSGLAASSGLFLRTIDKEPGVCKRPLATGVDFGNLKYDVVPGAPEKSILLSRMASRQGVAQMPEIGNVLVDPEGLALVSDWIKKLDIKCP